jgi:hypothetical protein
MKKTELEIDEDIAFQVKEWRGQRIGISLLFLFVLGALLGLTGMGGPLSHGEAGDRDGAVHLEYERIVRRGGFAAVTLHLQSSAAGDLRFWVSAPYFEHVRVESVAPQPEVVSVEEGRHVYTIHAGSTDVTVVMEVEHKTIGRLHGEVGLVEGPSVRFSQVSLF